MRFDFSDVDWYPWVVSQGAKRQADYYHDGSAWRSWVSNGANSWGDNKLIWPPPAVCDHPVALLQVTDNMAFCDGCGRTFELRKFGGTL